MTTEEFIKKAKKVHGDKYDYSKVSYVDRRIKITIICPIHGEYQDTPERHLSGFTCPKCREEERRLIREKEFIEKATKIHNGKYDYSKVKYINSDIPVTIICPIHGEFQQTPKCHLSGSGCKKCDIDSRKITKEEFIKRAKEIHGDKYDYSKVEYINNYTPVTIICPIHGEFQQKPYSHLEGSECKKCSTEKRAEMISLTTEEFIKRARKVHGDKYDYSKSVYTGYNNKITIICPVHGEFEQRASSHLEGYGCNLCICDAKRLTKDKFVELARKVHGDKYDYSKVEYTNNKSKVTIVCPIHGEFEQTPNSHLRGAGCLSCSNSRLEDQMEEFLLKNNIKYFHEKTWDWLTYSSYQYVDFYLPDYNMVIECQGIQHFESVEFFGGEKGLIYNQERDKNKRDLCEKHGIKVAYFSNLSTETEKYQYPYKVYEDEYKLFKEELNLIIN